MGKAGGPYDLPPGPATPGAWQLLRCQMDFAGYLDRCVARHGPLFTLRIPPFDAFVAATEPHDVERVLMGTTTRFVDGAATALLVPLIGRSSLILSSGATHMRQRRQLLPAFHGGVGERWEASIARVAERHVARLPLGEPVALREPMRLIALDVICEILFGADEQAHFAALRDEIARGIDPRIALLLWFPTLWRRNGRLNPARPLQARRRHIHALVDEQIARRRADPARGERDDVLSRLVSAGDAEDSPAGDEELRDQLLALMMAGHETTANALTWAFERLSRSPHARQRLDAELHEGRTEYLDAVVSETLRTRPPVIDAVRTTTDELELGGYRIAPGTVVSAMLTAMHRRPELWSDPLAFKPERFLAARPAPYSYAPFGGGVRHCIGASLSLVELRTVLRTALAIVEVAPAPNPTERMRLTGITLTPSRGGRVVLRRRA